MNLKLGKAEFRPQLLINGKVNEIVVLGTRLAPTGS